VAPVPQGVLAGGRYVGFEGLRRFWTDFFGAWDEISVEPEEFSEGDDLIAARVQMRGRMQDIEVDEVWSWRRDGWRAPRGDVSRCLT
jgi:hypothetical protein